MKLYVYIKLLFGKILIAVVETTFSYSRKSTFGKCLNKLFSSLLRKVGLSYFSIESVDTYSTKRINFRTKILIPERKGVEGIYSSVKKPSTSLLSETRLPAIRLNVFTNVIISGNSDMIVDLDNQYIINDTCHNIDPNIFFVDGLLYRQKNNVGLLRNNMHHIDSSVESGIMLCGKFSTNYYHSLFENLCRLILLQECDIPENVPFLVDEKVLSVPSFKRIFELLSSNSHREHVALCPGKLYRCNKLYSFDHINKIPPHLLDSNKNKGLLVYDPSLMLKVKNHLLSSMSDRSLPKRIFITRKKTKSRHFNETEVFNILKKYGFEEVSPEKYTFEEQMKLFHDAEWIIGGSGAAMTNLLFCSSNCNIICFRSSFVGEEPSIFNTIAYFNGCGFWYMEPKSSSNTASVHSDYIIDVAELETFLLPYFKN